MLVASKAINDQSRWYKSTGDSTAFQKVETTSIFLLFV